MHKSILVESWLPFETKKTAPYWKPHIFCKHCYSLKVPLSSSTNLNFPVPSRCFTMLVPSGKHSTASKTKQEMLSCEVSPQNYHKKQWVLHSFIIDNKAGMAESAPQQLNQLSSSSGTMSPRWTLTPGCREPAPGSDDEPQGADKHLGYTQAQTCPRCTNPWWRHTQDWVALHLYFLPKRSSITCLLLLSEV